MANMSNLFKLMDERGIKAIQLSKETGISTGLISEWKNGIKQPGKKSLAKLCEYFKVTEAYLLGYSDELDEKSAPFDEKSALISEIVAGFSQLTPENQQAVAAVIASLLKTQ